MKSMLLSLVLLGGLTAHAGIKFRVHMAPKDLNLSSVERTEGNFKQINVAGFESDRTVGAPELPVKSWLVKGTPEQIRASLNVRRVQTIAGKPFPVQEQDCRCETDKVKTFKINSELYAKNADKVSVQYFGAFRGQAVSRVDVRFGSYSVERNEILLTTEGDVSINAPVFQLPDTAAGDLKDYLIVAPTSLVDGVTAFADYKRTRGYNVYVESVATPANDQAALQALIKRNYTEKGIDFVILVGDENTLPMFKVSTSASSQTPSDLKYYTMDGASDNIPDMFASRIAASTPAQVTAQLAKAIEFEQGTYQNSAGLKKFIGIASNEGSNPSDNDYVKSIGDKLKQSVGAEVAHFWQNDAVNSKPTVLNGTFNSGAFWLTYLGHGSGTSWPSMAQTYSVTHIRQITNQPVVKPIIIDVACQNGRLVNGQLGTSFMKTEGTGFGAAAYFGGSVNISWHPPAIMARGITFEQADKKYGHLGEAILAGQLYLAANWNNQADVIDNYEWYHLQGDPGMEIKF